MWGGIPIPVLALTMCAFCIGTAEFVVMGLLPDIARDLAVSIPLAGQVVTAYALGVVIGAPILAIATGKMERKRVILLTVGIFIVGNLLSAIAPNYALLLIARILAAFAHGAHVRCRSGRRDQARSAEQAGERDRPDVFGADDCEHPRRAARNADRPGVRLARDVLA